MLTFFRLPSLSENRKMPDCELFYFSYITSICQRLTISDLLMKDAMFFFLKIHSQLRL